VAKLLTVDIGQVLYREKLDRTTLPRPRCPATCLDSGFSS